MFLYQGHWLPARSPAGPPPEDDSKFQRARNLARQYAITGNTLCAVTELSFGFLRAKVPVLIVATKPGEVLPDQYFDAPYVHLEESFAGISAAPSASGERPHEPESSEQLEVLTPESPSSHRERMHKIICQDYTPPSADTTDPFIIRSSKVIYRSRLAALVNSGVTRPQIDRVLYHGASISRLNELSRGSFGLYLVCETWKPEVFYLTAGHVAPYPSVVQTPCGLDMIKEPFKQFRPNFSWGNLEQAEELSKRAFERCQLAGDTICSEMGVESDYGWRVDFSLVKRSADLHETANNGFGHIEDLQEFAANLFPLNSNWDEDAMWWLKCSPDELKRTFERIDGFGDPNLDGQDRVFKDGAVTGLTTGVVNGRRVFCYFPNSATSTEHSHSSHDCCMFDVIVSSYEDQSREFVTGSYDFSAKGDSGSGTFKMVSVRPNCWRVAWTGLLVSQWNDEKLKGSLGLAVPASAVLRQVKSWTGEEFHPAA